MILPSFLFAQQKETFPFEGEQREYYLHIPKDLKEGAPLVLVLHGYALPYDKTPKTMDAIADREGFVVCYPQGRKDYKNFNYWNIGYPVHKNETNDDVAFIKELSKFLRKKLSLSQVFMCGFSNGGDMCYLTALSSPGFISAYASVAGLFMVDWKEKYNPVPALPFMEIHGTKDGAVRWDGDYQGADGWGKYISVKDAVGYMILHNECTSMSVDTLRRKGPHMVIRTKWAGGRRTQVPEFFPRSEVVLCKVVGSTHGWQEEDMDTFEVIWEFFKRYLCKSKTYFEDYSLEAVSGPQMVQGDLKH